MGAKPLDNPTPMTILNKKDFTMQPIKPIASFTVDHDLITEGIYISRIDGDVTTYDLRTRRPNMGDYMDNCTMHSVEHMFATYVRSSSIGEDVIYFGQMGCQTGFYLMVRSQDHERTLAAVYETLDRIIAHDGPMFGAERRACGNYKNLDLACAKEEARRMRDALRRQTTPFIYGGQMV